MASNPKYSVAARKAYWNGTSLNTLLGAAGALQFYDGPVPAHADSALSRSNTVLATLPLSQTPFSSLSGRAPGDPVTITSAAITPDPDAHATGIATFFRLLDSARIPAPQVQGTVGKNDCDINLNSTDIQIHAAVSVSSLVLTLPA